MIFILFAIANSLLSYFGILTGTQSALFTFLIISTLIYLLIIWIKANKFITECRQYQESLLPEFNQLRAARGADTFEGIAEFGEGFGEGFAEESDDIGGFLIGKAIEFVSGLVGDAGKTKREKELQGMLVNLENSISNEKWYVFWGISFMITTNIVIYFNFYKNLPLN